MLAPESCARRPPPLPSDAQSVTTKAGAVLWVRPCRVTPGAILAGTCTPYQEAVLALRAAWVRADLYKRPMEAPAALWEAVALGVLLEAYQADRATINEWIAADDQEAIVTLCAIACGRDGETPEALAAAALRRRAMAAAMAGLTDVPLTAADLHLAADHAQNTGAAPKG